MPQRLVQVLKQCDDNPTRENIMKKAANLHDFSEPNFLGRYGRPRRSSGTNRPDELIAGSADDFAGGQLAK